MSADAYNKKQLDSGAITPSHISELTRFWQRGNRLPDDGMLGPHTLGALKKVIDLQSAPKGTLWPHWDGPATRQPRNRNELIEILGQPQLFDAAGNPVKKDGKPVADPKWERANIIELRRRTLVGVPAHLYITVHSTVFPYLEEACKRANAACPDYKIERFWCYNFRTIRHEPDGELSTHAFGAAVDVNPHLNQAHSFKRGEGPAAWSDEWNRIWPRSVPPEFVQAFQSCGFAWGSDWDEDGLTTDTTFHDPMHFEWVARDGKNLMV